MDFYTVCAGIFFALVKHLGDLIKNQIIVGIGKYLKNQYQNGHSLSYGDVKMNNL